MTTMQTMSRKMHTFAPAFCADAGTFCTSAPAMQSAPTSMMIMGAMIMASIIIFSVLVAGLVLPNLYALLVLVVVLVVVLLHNIIIVKEKSRTA